MNSIFNYQTLEVNLSRETRTLFITLNQDYINTELLFELESVFAWCTNKTEIRSILLKSNKELFSMGYQLKILTEMSSDKIQQFTKKLQTINLAISCLPQTVICDLGRGTINLGAELAMACDIRIAHEKSYISFNHTKLGLVPSSGGLSTLSRIVGSSNAKNWIMSASDISINTLKSSGFVFKSYSESTKSALTHELLFDIHQQSEVARIQTKLGLSEQNREDIEKYNQFETKLSNAALITEDWKTQSTTQNMPAKHLGVAVKLSLIKNDENLS